MAAPLSCSSAMEGRGDPVPPPLSLRPNTGHQVPRNPESQQRKQDSGQRQSAPCWGEGVGWGDGLSFPAPSETPLAMNEHGWDSALLTT